MNGISVSAGCLILLGLLTVLPGCATSPEVAEVEPTASSVRSNATVQRDDDTGEIWVMTPPYFPEGRYGIQLSLMSRTSPGESVRYQVYLFTKRIEWAYFDRALGPEGELLQVEFYGREVIGPNEHVERIGAWISRESLEASREDGLRVVFVGRTGQQPALVPGFLVSGFLAKVDQVHP